MMQGRGFGRNMTEVVFLFADRHSLLARGG